VVGAAATAAADVLLPHDLYGLSPLAEALAGAALVAVAQLAAGLLAWPARARAWAAQRPARSWTVATLVVVAIVVHRAGSPNSLGGNVMLIATAPVVYSLIVFTLSPAALLVVQGTACLGTWIAHRRGGLPILGLRLPLLYLGLSLCLSLVYFGAFKVGPSSRQCREIEEDLPHPPVLGLERIRGIPGLEQGLPYDAVPSSDGTSLVVALKRTDGQPGGLVKIDARGDVVGLETTPAQAPGDNSFPERIAVSRELRRIYALVYGPGRFRLFAFHDGPGTLRLEREIPLPGEPISLYVDESRQELWIGFAAEVEAGAIVYALPGLEPVASTGNLGSTQHMAALDSRQQLLIATMSKDYKVAVLDRERKQRVQGWPYRFPLYGITLPFGDPFAVASSPLTRSLVLFDLDTGQVRDSIPVSGGLAELDRDPERPLVFVGDYAGTVDVVDVEAKTRLATYHLGHMLRGVYFDPTRRLLYAWSGCGVFAIDPDARPTP
jgi:hypothetical protein